MTIDNELEEAAYEMETSLFDEDSHPDLLREAANHIRTQEARIAALSKDAERLKFFNQVWRWKALKDGEIIYQYGEHVPSLFQKTAELLPTHQPAPKAITAEDVTDEMLDLVETTTTGAGAWDMVKPKELIAAAVNAFNGVKP
jgi:hypothetical protein